MCDDESVFLIEKEGGESVEVAEDYLEDYCIESDLERK